MTSRREFMALAGGLLAMSAGASATDASARAGSRRFMITQIRNATLKVEFSGVRFLIDPILADKGAYPGLAGTVNNERRNPLVHLPFPISDIIDVDAVLVSHLHPDHWDEAAIATIPKAKPIFVQNASDAAIIRSAGFQNVTPIENVTEFRGVNIFKTGGQHASDEIYAKAANVLGEVSGFIFKGQEEETLYIAGDTVWNHHVRSAIRAHEPNVIVLNAGYAQFEGLGPVLMGTDDVLAVSRFAPDAFLVASHMEAINHCVLTRADLRKFAGTAGFSGRLFIPEDGETLTF